MSFTSKETAQSPTKGFSISKMHSVCRNMSCGLVTIWRTPFKTAAYNLKLASCRCDFNPSFTALGTPSSQTSLWDALVPDCCGTVAGDPSAADGSQPSSWQSLRRQSDPPRKRKKPTWDSRNRRCLGAGMPRVVWAPDPTERRAGTEGSEQVRGFWRRKRIRFQR